MGLVQHWLDSGSPAGPLIKGLGGFEVWRQLTSSVLHAAGVTGFGAETGRPSSLLLYDDGTGEFIQSWWDAHGSKRVVAKDLRSCSPPVDGDSSRAMGAYLQRLPGRVFQVSHKDGELDVQVISDGQDARRTRCYRLAPL